MNQQETANGEELGALPGRRRRVVLLIVLTAVVGAGAAAGYVASQDEGRETVAAHDVPVTVTTTTSEVPTTVTSITTTSIVTTTSAALPATTAVPTTTTTRPPRPGFTLSPTSGPSSTNVVAVGTGCTGTNAGVTIRVFGPGGEELPGTGTSAREDGSWQVSQVVPPGPAGRYEVRAECVSAAARFDYRPQYFTMTA